MNGGGGEGFLKVNEGGAKDFLRQKQKSRTKYFLIQLLGPLIVGGFLLLISG